MDDNSTSPSKLVKSWDGNRRGKVPAYSYKSIQDIRNAENPKECSNIYGVVVDSRPVEKSRGTDFFCLLRLVDPSYCEDEGVKVTLFHHDEDQLPKVDQYDIIRLHRVRPSSHQGGQLALISSHGWSWWVCPGMSTSADAVAEGRSSSKTSTILDEDLKKVASLRKWISEQGFMNLNQVRNASADGEDRKLKDLTSGRFFNLVGQVTGVTRVRDDYIILKIWDATLPSHKIAPASIPEDITCECNILGNMENIEHYMVDVSVFDNHVHTVDEESIDLGSFVRFCNLHASAKHKPDATDNTEVCSELFLHRGIVFNRGIVTLDDDSDCVKELKESMLTVVQTYNLITNSSDEEEPKGASSSTGKRTHSEEPSTPDLKKRKLSADRGESNVVSPAASETESVFVTPPQHRDNLPTKTPKSSSGVKENLPSRSSMASHTPLSNQIPFSNVTTLQSPNTLSMLVSMDSLTAKNKTPSVIPTHRSVGVQVTDSVMQSNSSKLSDLSQPTDASHNSKASSSFNIPLPSSFTDESVADYAAMRCHQESATVVFGENCPLKITSIQKVISEEVPLRKSKLFRIRAQVFRCSNLNKSVCHFCPATGLRFTAKNDGQKINIPAEMQEYLNMWRQYRGLNEGNHTDDTNSALDTSDGLSESHDEEDIMNTQWHVLTGDGDDSDGVRVEMETFANPEDDSKWETLSCKSNISRKRKAAGKKFNILYRQDTQCVADLKELSKNFNRVIRVSSKESLTSCSIPPVVYQNGIYYYCSPGCVRDVAVPTLAEEARTFHPDKPLWAVGSPVLLLQFYLKLLLEDDSDVMEATLKGQDAIDFFNGTTPSQYLLNTNGCHEWIYEDIERICCSEEDRSSCPWVEMVIEKKSRRPLPGQEGPVILYQIKNTRLVSSQST